MLQYRTAAVAGFFTQCWWGIILVMVLAAFFHGARAHQPISFTQAVTYTWLGQAFLVLLPWSGDPEVGEMVRSGNVSYDRLRPLDTYFYWYVRAMAWMAARVVPRATLMLVMAGLIFPLIGLGAWRLRLPPDAAAGLLFAPALASVVLLSSAMVMLINASVVVTVSDRGVNTLAAPIVILLSGNLLPLPLFPDWMHWFLFLQPFAGLIDIPFRIYVGNLTGTLALAGLALQIIWIGLLILLGRYLMRRAMCRLQVQGG